MDYFLVQVFIGKHPSPHYSWFEKYYFCPQLFGLLNVPFRNVYDVGNV
jgi:hypothetical protein